MIEITHSIPSTQSNPTSNSKYLFQISKRTADFAESLLLHRLREAQRRDSSFPLGQVRMSRDSPFRFLKVPCLIPARLSRRQQAGKSPSFPYTISLSRLTNFYKVVFLHQPPSNFILHPCFRGAHPRRTSNSTSLTRLGPFTSCTTNFSMHIRVALRVVKVPAGFFPFVGN